MRIKDLPDENLFRMRAYAMSRMRVAPSIRNPSGYSEKDTSYISPQPAPDPCLAGTYPYGA